jgi:hypothetical protein
MALFRLSPIVHIEDNLARISLVLIITYLVISHRVLELTVALFVGQACWIAAWVHDVQCHTVGIRRLELSIVLEFGFHVDIVLSNIVQVIKYHQLQSTV